MKKILLSVLLSVQAGFGFAQQDPQFTQNMFLKLPVNPGYAGIKGMICGTAAYRSQWVNFPGAPKTFLFTADMPVPEIGGGAGFTVMKDKLGNFNFTSARAAYSYHIPVNNEKGLLGIGFELGMLQASVDNNWLAPDGSNGYYDNAIPNGFINKASYDFGAGFYYNSQKLHAGFSVSHLPGKSEKLTAISFNYHAARHYYLTAGYDFSPSKRITLRPSVFAKTDGAVIALDFHCDILFDESIWGGISYRLKDAIAPMIGAVVYSTRTSFLKIGYAYDIGTSDLKVHHANTHEIVVNYCIKFESPKGSHIPPRFMWGKYES